jgi:hypothetical protein
MIAPATTEGTLVGESYYLEQILRTASFAHAGTIVNDLKGGMSTCPVDGLWKYTQEQQLRLPLCTVREMVGVEGFTVMAETGKCGAEHRLTAVFRLSIIT